jgi:hypothetical protein
VLLDRAVRFSRCSLFTECCLEAAWFPPTFSRILTSWGFFCGGLSRTLWSCSVFLRLFRPFGFEVRG